MGTVSKDIADQIVTGKGHYKDDPLVVKIIRYTSKWGDDCYGLIYRGQDPDHYAETPFVQRPTVYWEIEK